MQVGEQVQLGRTRLRVTRMGLGTAPLGNLYEEVWEEPAKAVVERAYQRGIRFFDTAPLYGYGLAEERVGAVLAGVPRDSFVLATKVGRLLHQALHRTRASSSEASPSTRRRRRSPRCSTSATTG